MATKEQLSALMDGDISDAALLSELGVDLILQDTWRRYHLIGDAIRGDLPTTLSLDFSDGVMAALAAEPALQDAALAPRSEWAIEPLTAVAHVNPALVAVVTPTVIHGAVVTPAAATDRRTNNVVVLLRRFSQQVGQYAIAASVAAAAIFGVQHYQGQEGLPLNPVLNTIPMGGSASPVSLHYPQEGQRGNVRQQGLTEQQQQEQQQRINAFLRDHQLQQRLLQDRQIQP